VGVRVRASFRSKGKPGMTERSRLFLKLKEKKKGPLRGVSEDLGGGKLTRLTGGGKGQRSFPEGSSVSNFFHLMFTVLNRILDRANGTKDIQKLTSSARKVRNPQTKSRGDLLDWILLLERNSR